MPRSGHLDPATSLETDSHKGNDQDSVPDRPIGANGAPNGIFISLPNSPSSCASSEPVGRELLRDASVDSLRSINEMIRAANLGRAATPQGMTLEFLKDALAAESMGGSPSLRSLLQGPDADELALRLRQLPDLWRTTILQMLEQAELVQKGVEEMTDEETNRLAKVYALA